MVRKELERASLTHLGTLESIEVLWNPERVAVSRRTRAVSLPVPGAVVAPVGGIASGSRIMTTDLLLDSTRKPEGERDLVPWAERVADWMRPEPGGWMPPELLFSWGTFRFRGIATMADSLWVRFDPDGTPVRGWLRLRLEAIGGRERGGASDAELES